MIATYQSRASKNDSVLKNQRTVSLPPALPKQKTQTTIALRAEPNSLVKAADILLSMLGKIQRPTYNKSPQQVKNELIQTLDSFQKNIIRLGYRHEYILVCRYIFCLTFDDVISNSIWGKQVKWQSCFLLNLLYQEVTPDKFFVIVRRIIKEPALYIDLMELIYICLKLGYQGEYRLSQQYQQLEHITYLLYKHIRHHRGGINKKLSPRSLIPLVSPAKIDAPSSPSVLFIFFVTASIIMAIFLSLSYLTDIISNETYKNITTIQQSVSFNIA